MIKNNLSIDPSPYLQQHKDNPVDWQVWSNAALKLAKENKKPILLSVGYASCHWCHVMAHESFEDIETAKVMNNNFINIKVDREERPDIDFVFQNSFQLFNNSNGGWPLTMFLDENAVPFMGGTYFPKIEKHGLPSFKDVLRKISSAYDSQRVKIIDQSKLIKKSLELKKSSVLKQDLIPVLDLVISNLDPINGGYKGSPKFPVFNVFDTLLYFFNKTKDEKFIKPVELILKKLCSQGIYDHVEGGISRYTVDDKWLVPHFEKMLYDNAQFILLLSKFYKIKPSQYYKDKIIQTISFLNKNFMVDKKNLMGSAYDADSEGEEGKYYTFLYDEIKNILNIEKYFEIEKLGNWEGKIILKEIDTPPNSVITELLKIRKNKKKPFFDNKNQLDLNSLFISSLINAHIALPDQNFLKQAEELFINIENNFCKKKIFHSNSETLVFLEDYAYLINGLIDLYDQTLNSRYILKAKELIKETINEFYIKEKKIFQKNKIKNNDLFISPIDVSDHTIPNGNSIMLMNFSRLGFKEESKELAISLNGYLNIYKTFMTSSIKSLDFYNEVSSDKNCNNDGCKT